MCILYGHWLRSLATSCLLGVCPKRVLENFRVDHNQEKGKISCESPFCILVGFLLPSTAAGGLGFPIPKLKFPYEERCVDPAVLNDTCSETLQ